MTLYVHRRYRPRVIFWCRFVVETCSKRRLPPLVAARLGREKQALTISGLEHVPLHGTFVLAVNHYNGRATLDVAAAVLHAVGQTRLDAVERMLFVVGSREHSKKRSLVARLLNCVYARWSGHAIRIPLGNEQSSVIGLRAWRERNQPVFVFPEGRARLHLGRMRHGAGRWLSSLDLPVIPVGVWWEQESGWHIVLSKPIRWTHRADLRDLQLGLALASLLPPDLAPDWQRDLERWHAAHIKMTITA